MSKNIFKILFISLISLLISSCSTRIEIPVFNSEKGITTYSPKDANGINAEVILYKGTDDITGLPLTADSFTLRNKGKVYTTVKLLNYNKHKNEDLMFHIDWISPDGNSFFRKRIDLPPNDSTGEIKGAISIQPEKRDTGNYKIRVYLFRELIAEKNFRLVNFNVDSASIFSDVSKSISAKISLGKKFDKDKDIPVDTGSIFMIRDKSKVYADIELLNRNFYTGTELKGSVNWCDLNDSTFYTKKISFSANDNSSRIKSTISINDKSREPGNYKVKVFLYGNLIGEKSFRVIPEQKEEIKVTRVKGIEANIEFAGKFNKKSQKYLNISDKFTLKEKAKVYAVITIKDAKGLKGKSSDFVVNWIGPNNKSFYKKILAYNLKDNSSLLSCSISISPPKRKPGEYNCRVYYNNTLICEKKFSLISESI